MERLRFAAMAAALAVALPTGATQKMTSTRTPAAKQSAPARAPAAVTDVPLPPPPTLAARTTPVAWFGAGVGALSAFDVGKGVAFQLDYGLLRTPPTWRILTLEWHLVGAFSRPSGEKDLTTTVTSPGGQPVSVDAGQEKVKALLFEIVPTARVLWTATPGVAFFADGGLGLCQTVEKYDRSELFMGQSTRTDYVTGAVARLALGMAADVAPRWRVVFLPVAFSFQLGPKFSAYTPTLGVAYRL